MPRDDTEDVQAPFVDVDFPLNGSVDSYIQFSGRLYCHNRILLHIIELSQPLVTHQLMISAIAPEKASSNGYPSRL